MKFFHLLPCNPEEVGDYVFDYLLNTHRELAELVDETEHADHELRWRNERLSARLGMLNIILSAYLQKTDFKRKAYIQAHPRPVKGVTEWREAFDALSAEERRICDHVKGVIAAIETRLSVTQSNLKSLGKES